MSVRDSFTDHPLLLVGATTTIHDEKASLVWASYFVLGAGILAPWNAFITASDYFNKMYATKHMDRSFTICYLPSCLITLALMVKLNNVFTYRSRVLCGFLGFFVLLLVVPLVDVALVAGHSKAPDVATVIVLGAVVVTGILDGISQGAVFADAATMPQQYTHAVVAGTASAGLLISVLRVITKAALPEESRDSSSGLRTSTAIYFLISAVIELVCVVIYTVVLPRIPSVQFHRSKVASEAGKLPAEPDSPSSVVATPTMHTTPSNDSAPLFTAHHISSYEHSVAMDVSKERLMDVMRHSWELSVSLVLIYAVTLSIFPGVLAEDVHSKELGDWYNVALFFTFNVADLLGRLIPFPTASWASPNPTRILHHSAARVLFIPAYLVAIKLQAHPVVMSLLSLLLGISNGYLTAAAMTIAPSGLSSADAGLVENIMVLALVAGLTLGAFSGWLWVT